MTEDSRTAESLLARRALAEKATPGPWGQVIAGLERVVIDSKGTVVCTVCLDEDFSDKETERQVLANLYYIAANSPDVVMADIDEILQLRGENEKLRQSVKIQRGMVQEAYQTAALAWGGEIPSPFPGHRNMTEDEVSEMFADLNCPWCGGSGHVGDCEEADQQVKKRIELLEKEADWLAEQLSYSCFFTGEHNCGIPRPCPKDYGFRCIDVDAKEWREAARHAVEKRK